MEKICPERLLKVIAQTVSISVNSTALWEHFWDFMQITVGNPDAKLPHDHESVFRSSQEVSFFIFRMHVPCFAGLFHLDEYCSFDSFNQILVLCEGKKRE